jgi:hypothetical protein
MKRVRARNVLRAAAVTAVAVAAAVVVAVAVVVVAADIAIVVNPRASACSISTTVPSGTVVFFLSVDC